MDCFSDLPTVGIIRNGSTICVTNFNISWGAPNSTMCGDVSYEVSISQPPIQVVAITTADAFFSVSELNSSLPDVTITVAASNRAGRGDVEMFSAQLPISLSKHCIHTNVTAGVYIIY